MTALAQDISIKPVNREEQIDDFLLALNRIETLGSIFQTIYEWHGGPGIGKSTLLKMLMGLCDERKVPYTFINFDPKRNANARGYSENISTLVSDLVDAFPKDLTDDVYEAIHQYDPTDKEKKQELQLGEIARAFQHFVNEFVKETPVVLFFDETEKADQDRVVPWLEEWIVNPLAQNGRCLFVWAGRRPQRFKRFEVRRRVWTQELPVFDERGTQVLFEKNSAYPLSDLAVPVRTLTGGHPFADTIVLRYLDAQAHKGRQPEKAHFDEIRLALLNELSQNFVYKFAFNGLAPDVIQACEVMSLARQFDIIMLREILSAAKPEVFGRYGRNEFGGLLSRLRSTQLVLWDDRRKGYALDPTLRRIMDEYICNGQAELYAEVNRTAIEIYKDWIQRAGDNRGIYIVEMLYQQACLNQLPKIEKKNLAELLGIEIKEYKQDDPELRASALNRLYHELESDDGLERKISAQERDRLLAIVGKARDGNV